MAECRKQLARELEGRLTQQELDDIFASIERRFGGPEPDRPAEMTDEDFAEYRKKLSGLSRNERIQEAAERAFDEAIKKKQGQLRRQYLQAEANYRLDQQIRLDHRQNFDYKKEKGGGHVNALVKILVGEKTGRHKELTLEARKNGILQLDMAELTPAFEEYLGTWGFKITRDQELAIVKEFDKPGSSGDKSAQKLVTTWLEWAERSRNRKNDLGADIGKLKDWRLPQSWDPHETKRFGLGKEERLRLIAPDALVPQAEKNALFRKAKEAWIAEAMQRVDRNKYTGRDGQPMPDPDLQYTLGEVFDIITTRGLSKTPSAIQTDAKLSLAQKLGEHRELHFKSALDWYEMNTRAGSTDILGMMQRTVLGNARDTALLEVFGPNPDGGFKTALAQALYYDSKMGRPFREHADQATMYFDEFMGTYGVPLSDRGEFAARAVQGLRQWMVAAKMGSVLLSQINDVATYAAIARTDGLGMGSAIKFAVQNLLPLGAEGKRMAGRLGIASQAMINDVAMRYGEAVRGTGMTSKFASGTVKLAGMNWWTDSMKRAYQMLIAFHAVDHAGKAFGDIGDAHFRSMLERYGIGAPEWEIIRQAPAAEISGQKMITPAAIKGLGDAPEIRDAAVKYAAMLAEEADVAIVTPGIREQAFTKGRTSAGTLTGEMWRSGMLFKSFTVALGNKVLPRIFGAEGTTGFKAGLAAQFAVSMIVAGGISYQLKQLAFGRNPRDIETPAFWVAAAAQSGGLGIFGDFLFADYNRFGGGAIGSLAGPIEGFALDVGKLTVGNIADALKGKDTHFGAEALQFAKNYTPLMNLWYTRAALDHLLFNQVQESLSPGYLRRMRQRVERENEQTFWWQPQDILPDEAPDIAYMMGGSQ